MLRMLSTASVTTTGVSIGKMTQKKARSGVQPSISAASSSSRGNVSMKA